MYLNIYKYYNLIKNNFNIWEYKRYLNPSYVLLAYQL